MDTSRIQLALNVSDIEAATRFYSDMFGVGPAKQRAGYANFEIADPPLKLVLFEHPEASSALNHLGVEVRSSADVVAAADRFAAAGLSHRMTESDRCCHAVQDKVWVDAPDVPARRLGGLHRPRRRPHQRRRHAERVLHLGAHRRQRAVLRRPDHGGRGMTGAAVLVEDLLVRFGDVQALAGIDFDVAPGTTLGVLGHNGAGKTTLIRVLTTLLRPTGGRAVVDGFDVVADADHVRSRIGVTGQYAGLDDFLTGRENLELIGSLTGLGAAARRRADELITRLDLGDVAERRVGALSGGSRRRIDLATSLVGGPSVLFLDEPTTGLDPVARSLLWDVVAELTARGTTVVLTTQYLEEADRLADDIVVLDHGRIAARGTPAELKRLVGGKVVAATVPTAHLDRISRRPDDTQPATAAASRVAYSTSDADEAAAVVTQLLSDGVAIDDLDITSPTLDDVFAQLTTQGAHR